MEPLIALDLPPEEEKTLMFGLGVFDGVHLGHRRIIEALVLAARKRGAVPVAVTFDPHPRAVLGGEPQLLLPFSERCRLLREAGAEGIGVIRFSREIAALEPEEFLARLSAETRFAGICVGEHWRFGREGKGDAGLLLEQSLENHWEFHPCPEIRYRGAVVSSSAIRTAVTEGRLADAEAMLGTPCRLFGKVVHGNGIAGPRLQAPTANLELSAGIRPPDGVYAAMVPVAGKRYRAAVNIGFAPTFSGHQRRIELHLLDFDGSLYDEELEVELHGFLRHEHRFPSEIELKQAIARDVAAIRELVSL